MNREGKYAPQKGDTPVIKRQSVTVGRRYPPSRFCTADDPPINRKQRRAARKNNQEKA